ncbi:L-aspartate oxidase [bacterium]|nr:L-aspartate oxidase [bacterium]
MANEDIGKGDKLPKQIRTNFLVIGSGIAGLSVALKLASLGKVIVLTKSKLDETNTSLAQGGIAAAWGKDDSPEQHMKDTLKVGNGLCEKDVVRKIVEYAPEAIIDLANLGVDFDRNKKTGEYDLGKEGGHTRKRVLHVGDYTGKAIQDVLIANAIKNENIELLKDHMAVDLLTQHHVKNYASKKDEKIHCWGVYAYDSPKKRVRTILSDFTILATGGAGKLYKHTTNSSIATGDGIAMAYRAGATVRDMEFIQFHPTMLFSKKVGQSFLISETLRGEGGILRLSSGEKFMSKYHELADLAPRDIVSRAIDKELKKSGEEYVYLDITHKDKDFIINRFPHIYKTCKEEGLDITQDWIPVVPSTHYTCGGVVTDEYGATDVERLYACGEVASVGLHGANRMASNSLLEGISIAQFIFEKIRTDYKKPHSFPSLPNWDDTGVFHTQEWVVISHGWKELRDFMWNYVGIVRSNSRLERANRRIFPLMEEIDAFYRKNPVKQDMLELRNLISVGELVIRSALFRKESRGLHYNEDFPNKDDKKFKVHTVIKSRGVSNEEHLE